MEIDILRARHTLLKAVRSFFLERGYLEVETPYLTPFAPSDAHIEPVSVFVGGKGPFFLHTSPEIGMKKLLALGYERIFQICKVFRVEELEEHHNTEFTMLEWYMPGTYRDAMIETEQLIRTVAGHTAWKGSAYVARTWKRYDLGALCLEHAGIDPLCLDRDSLEERLRERGSVGIGNGEAWEELFFRLFLQEVEPRIHPDMPYFIEDWPVAVSSMAKRKDGHRVERFELYMRGLEIANGYTELLDAEEQRARFEEENCRRKKLGRKPLPVDEEFLAALPSLKGPCAGVSVGLDRLLMVLLEKQSIGEVLCSRFRP
ncbi:MAG: EF-P lysine aminoacylase EpmA [candidate division WOR-3 bacterium]